MKKTFYLKSLVAPLSMLMVFACSPDLYHQQGEYDDIYFTKNDRKQQPAVVPGIGEDPTMATQNSSQAAIPVALQEKYNNSANPSEVVYFEEQGAKVQAPSDLNYDDFVSDYENGFLAYYELPLDWETDWTPSSFNELMLSDYQFRHAWYDQYYKGSDWRMNLYLNGSVGTTRTSPFQPQVGLSVGASPVFGNSYYGGIWGVDLRNPYGFYDPFWRPISRWSFSVGFGWNAGFYDPWYSPFYFNNFYAGSYWGRPWGGSWGNTIIINNGENNFNGRTVTRSGRLSSTSITSVTRDSQNGAQVRSRSQRAVQGEATNARLNQTRSGRADISARSGSNGRQIGRNNRTRADLTTSRLNRASTDQNRINTSNRSSRLTRSRIDASRSSSGRSINSLTRGSSRSSFTRADIGRTRSVSNNSRAGSLSFDRTSSSRITRSVASRNSVSRGSSGRFSQRGNAGASRYSGLPSGRSNSRGISTSRGSSRARGVSSSRGSSSRSSGVSSSRGSSSGRSGGASRSGRSGGSSGRGRN